MSFPCIAGDPSHCFIIILCRRGRFSLRIRFSAWECSLASSLNQNGSRKPSASDPLSTTVEFSYKSPARAESITRSRMTTLRGRGKMNTIASATSGERSPSPVVARRFTSRGSAYLEPRPQSRPPSSILERGAPFRSQDNQLRSCFEKTSITSP